jgi:tetratricopeptide (TPR) repeat protein
VFAAAYQTRGFARSNIGDFKEAIEDFNIALDCLDRGNIAKRSQILYQRGYAYMRLGKKAEACNDGKESLQLNPANDRAG